MATKKTAAPAVATPAAPTPEHHFNLGLFLQALVAVAPAVISPFIKNPQSQAIASTEAGVAGALIAALNQPK